MHRNHITLLKQNYNHIKQYIPEGALGYIQTILEPYQVNIIVSNKRLSKYGDFRPSQASDKENKITINKDLNQYHFLVILIHEIAHLYVHEHNKGKRIKPHGQEWKNMFKKLLIPVLLNPNVKIPETLNQALQEHIINPKSSTSYDPTVSAEFRKYDKASNTINKITLKDISNGQKFIFRDRIFTKTKSNRTRTLCKEVNSGKSYLIHDSAGIEIVEK